MTAIIESWLLDALGRRVVQVLGEFYEGAPPAASESATSIWVQFEGAARVRLFGTPDGWGIGLDEAPPTESDLGSSGRTVLRDMLRKRPFSQCMDSVLHKAALLTSTESPHPIGVRLSFESEREVLVLNWGDELVVDDRPPGDAAPGDLVACPVEKRSIDGT